VVVMVVVIQGHLVVVVVMVVILRHLVVVVMVVMILRHLVVMVMMMITSRGYHLLCNHTKISNEVLIHENTKSEIYKGERLNTPLAVVIRDRRTSGIDDWRRRKNRLIFRVT